MKNLCVYFGLPCLLFVACKEPTSLPEGAIGTSEYSQTVGVDTAVFANELDGTNDPSGDIRYWIDAVVAPARNNDQTWKQEQNACTMTLIGRHADGCIAISTGHCGDEDFDDLTDNKFRMLNGRGPYIPCTDSNADWCKYEWPNSESPAAQAATNVVYGKKHLVNLYSSGLINDDLWVALIGQCDPTLPIARLDHSNLEQTMPAGASLFVPGFGYNGVDGGAYPNDHSRWYMHVAQDNTGDCKVVDYQTGRIMVYDCDTDSGDSGSPIFRQGGSRSSTMITAIHYGTEAQNNKGFRADWAYNNILKNPEKWLSQADFDKYFCSILTAREDPGSGCGAAARTLEDCASCAADCGQCAQCVPLGGACSGVGSTECCEDMYCSNNSCSVCKNPGGNPPGGPCTRGPDCCSKSCTSDVCN